ncbi:Leucine-rich repeat receptor-like tyrosine-protein kinase PXC3 [Linum perenne]
MKFLYFSCLILAGCLCSATEQEEASALMAINAELQVPGWGGLGSSTNDSSYCNWYGVFCSSNNSVIGLSLPRLNLRGNLTPISALKSLKRLDLSGNNFAGEIPREIGNLTQLQHLDLSVNKFTGFIPIELGNLVTLESLNISNNMLLGLIPDELQIESLEELQISGNSLNGSIPPWIGNLTQLKVFTAYENLLTGEIPGNLGVFSSELKLLNLHSNQLEGEIPDGIFLHGKLESLILTQNRFNGSVPESIGKCRSLSSVRIGNNELTGGVPWTIGNLTSLTYFEADSNHLSGSIVPEFSKCSNLTLLNLASNGFTGFIPPELGQLENLQELILSENSLSGGIPTSIVGCRSLNKLDLTKNQFNGTIPIEICTISRLQYLLLGQNSLRGEIPKEIGNCAKLLELQLGGNYIVGSIPPEIGHIRNLQIALNLSYNHLHGSLPTELGKLDKLVSLDVSNNQLTGDIPLSLKGMLSLIEVNFSNNLLTGEVPTFVPFQKSPDSSFSGNKGLCGEPLGSSCGGSYPDVESYHRRVSLKVVMAVIGSGLAVFISVTVVVLLFMMRENQEKESKSVEEEGESELANENSPPTILASNVFIDSLRQAIDVESVVKSTLKDSNKVSSGTFSTVYKAVMPSGMSLSVRKLKSMDRTIVQHRGKMIRELERLSKLSHDNLVQPVGFVVYEDVALLLHEYLPNGTLGQMLHETSKKADYEPDWPTRLSIATGVARGLAFLHNVAIIHLDVSSGNVLLDADFRPVLGEIEISKLLDPSRGTASISAVAGSFGYIPPEYAYTMQVTAPGNVYSYGVVLLEILTTRLPVEEEFGEGVDLVKWVHGAPGRGETPEQILDSKLSTVSFGWRREMVAALKVALLCTDSTPAKRPKMKKVVEMLEEIRETN